MSNVTRYLHQLEQIGCELRDIADSVEECLADLRKGREENVSLDELKAKYHEFIKHRGASDVIDRLHEIVRVMKHDESLEMTESLSPDLIAANGHALRMCTALLAIAQVITGA